LARSIHTSLCSAALAAGIATGVSAAEPMTAAPPPAPRVTVDLRGVPLRAAIRKLYAGTGLEVSIDSSVPDVAVTARIVDVPRSVALRSLLQLSGVPRLSARQESGRVSVAQAPAPATITAPIQYTLTSGAGFSVGPNGVLIPNLSVLQIRALRRVQPGAPAQLGGVSGGRYSSSRNGIPHLPFRSSLGSRNSSTGGTFVTITILPDPGEERRR
jgi:hypothetical protein